MILVAVIFFWIAPIALAVNLGRGKDRAGLAYGFFLGWLGVLILFALGPRYGDQLFPCPSCGGTIRRGYHVCSHCGSRGPQWG